MGKKLVILSSWKGKDDFQHLKSTLEKNITGNNTVFYLICVDQPKLIEELPQMPSVNYLSKKDFSLFGKIKTLELRGLLINEKNGVLIVAMEESNSLLNKVIKHSKLMSIGMDKESLPRFDITFKGAELNSGVFFKQINNYLTKIQL